MHFLQPRQSIWRSHMLFRRGYGSNHCSMNSTSRLSYSLSFTSTTLVVSRSQRRPKSHTLRSTLMCVIILFAATSRTAPSYLSGSLPHSGHLHQGSSASFVFEAHHWSAIGDSVRGCVRVYLVSLPWHLHHHIDMYYTVPRLIQPLMAI